jgi:hypothetical protein
MMEDCVSRCLVESRIRLDDLCEAISSGANKHNHSAAQRHFTLCGVPLIYQCLVYGGEGRLVVLIEANQI